MPNENNETVPAPASAASKDVDHALTAALRAPQYERAPPVKLTWAELRRGR